MASEFCVQVRQKFYEITSEGTKIASQQVSMVINEIHQEKLSPEQTVLHLFRIMQSISGETDKLEKKEYYCFAHDKQFIFNIFISRILCNNKEEEQALRDGWMLYEKHHQIHDLFLKSQEQLPPFTFNDYMANVYHLTFYEHGQRPHGTSQKEYRRIRQWQTSQKEICAMALFSHFRKRLLSEAKSPGINKELLQTESGHLEHIFNNAGQWNANMFVKELFRLKGLTALFLNNEIGAFHRDGSRFFNGEKISEQLCPAYFQAAMKDIAGGLMPSFPVFGMSLYLYHRWLNKVLNSHERMDEPVQDSYSALFDFTYSEGLSDSALKIERVIRKNRMIKNTKEEYEAEIMKKMDKLWIQYNGLKYPHYFHFLSHKQRVKDCFISDGLKSLHVEVQKKELKRAIVIKQMITYYKEELSLLNHNPLSPCEYNLSDFYHLTEILSYMAPDTALLLHYLKAMSRIKNRCQTATIPIYFINKDITQASAEIFRQAVINIKLLLEQLPEDNRGCFCNNQLRELKYLEIMNITNKCLTNPYLKHLKQIFKDELNNIKKMKPYKQVEIINMISAKTPPGIKPFCFGYHPGPRPLKPILTAMNLRMNLFAGDTTVDDFMAVITCRDLSKNTIKIHLGCKTNLFYYFMKKCEPWASYFTPARIEKSGIFISLNEGPINAHVLYNSKIILAEDSEMIDAIFNAKYK